MKNDVNLKPAFQQWRYVYTQPLHIGSRGAQWYQDSSQSISWVVPETRALVAAKIFQEKTEWKATFARQASPWDVGYTVLRETGGITQERRCGPKLLLCWGQRKQSRDNICAGARLARQTHRATIARKKQSSKSFRAIKRAYVKLKTELHVERASALFSTQDWSLDAN